MIPVVTLDNKGEVIGHQAFNDNLTIVEQINRAMVELLFTCDQKLTNDKNKLDQILMSGAYTAEQLETLKTAVLALNKSMSDAITAFETAIVIE